MNTAENARSRTHRLVPSPEERDRLIARYERRLRQLRGEQTALCVADLPPKLQKVAHLIGRGLSNRGIAECLQLTEGTIKVYISKMYTEFGFELNDDSRRVRVARMCWEEERERTEETA